ncbi:MAG: aminotransferase class I/II-fold pyridoxal phosphate-dependent enzyme [Rhodobacteraceae bacterium]|nr:aminotransferase class I/II-fold pyridoxal phosphate-dependent enzyme [Paracoccaceae bacterium]
MKTAEITNRLAGLGGAKWDVHFRGRELSEQGRDIIELTIGEPDVPTPDEMIQSSIKALDTGRTGYSNGRGEMGLRQALAAFYSERRGRPFTPNQVLCLPGTQTALYAAMLAVAEAGDEVLVGDPMYATYEGVIRASGATPVHVPLRPEHGFRMQAKDLEALITPRSRALLLNSPHNPTGAVLSMDEIEAIAELALKHDLWIISDEVYEELVFDGATFASPLSLPQISDRTVAVSSISKSHAAPGFRSGWCVGSEAFCDALLPLAETMLFGNQPFIADMTAEAVQSGSPVAAGMRKRFQARAQLLKERLEAETRLTVSMPQAGMFALVNVSGLGLDGDAYALDLLGSADVSVMPGSSFGTELRDWVRVALTVEDDIFAAACDRIVAHAQAKAPE